MTASKLKFKKKWNINLTWLWFNKQIIAPYWKCNFGLVDFKDRGILTIPKLVALQSAWMWFIINDGSSCIGSQRIPDDPLLLSAILKSCYNANLSSIFPVTDLPLSNCCLLICLPASSLELSPLLEHTRGGEEELPRVHNTKIHDFTFFTFYLTSPTSFSRKASFTLQKTLA